MPINKEFARWKPPLQWKQRKRSTPSQRIITVASRSPRPRPPPFVTCNSARPCKDNDRNQPRGLHWNPEPDGRKSYAQELRVKLFRSGLVQEERTRRRARHCFADYVPVGRRLDDGTGSCNS